MNDADQICSCLLKSRNEDGGWPFRHGHSWTEPTALALLALQSVAFAGEARTLGASWLARGQLPDGGWPPCRSIPASTWVTSLALLCLMQEPTCVNRIPPAARWLQGQVYDDPPPLLSTVQRWLGVTSAKAPGSAPWFPGTAGWVIPTALTILALTSASRSSPDPALSKTIHRAQAYLFSRRCADGGWNHGGSPYRSENAASYGETTGIALLALHNYPKESLAPALQLANRFIQHPDSLEGFSWLQLGLAAHGQQPPSTPLTCTPPSSGPRSTRDLALRLIALRALQGNNALLSQVTNGKSA